MIARITSFAYTPAASLPVTSIRRVFGRASARHCVASTSRTCEVPIPNATAPNAPCVEVWLSPHAIVMPGWVRPSSGPITCTMPWWPEAASNRRDPFARRVLLERNHHLLGERVGERALLRVGRDDVVDGGERALGEAHGRFISRSPRTPAGS
jgi:hypothetical protein